MRILLDTHTLIWAIVEPGRLSSAATAAITANGAEVYASHVSLWEMAIKRRLGKLEIVDRPALEWFNDFVSRSGLRQLAISADHLGGAESLPALHSDPFDRLLVAQARHERLSVLTQDRLVTQYDVDAIW